MPERLRNPFRRVQPNYPWQSHPL